MVEKFGYSASQVTLLFLVNYVFNWFFAERIGRLISRVGERMALTFEYIGLIFVFVAYGLVENATLAAALCMCWTICSLPWRLRSAHIFKKSLTPRIWPAVLVCRSPSVISQP